MAYEQKDFELVLFVNDKKESDSHPDSKGKGMVNGVRYWASAWRNKSKDGKPYLKIKLTPVDSDGADQREDPYPRTRESVTAKRQPSPFDGKAPNEGVDLDDCPF